MKSQLLRVTALLALGLFIVMSFVSMLAHANHDTTGLMQGRTACALDSKGIPTGNFDNAVETQQCLVVQMPGYPDQVWVFVEAANGDVQAVYLMDKSMNVLKKLWTLGTPI